MVRRHRDHDRLRYVDWIPFMSDKKRDYSKEELSKRSDVEPGRLGPELDGVTVA